MAETCCRKQRNVYCLKCCVRPDTKNMSMLLHPTIVAQHFAGTFCENRICCGYINRCVDWTSGADMRRTWLHTVPTLNVCEVSSVGHINLIMYATEKCLVFISVPFTSWEISHSSRLYFVRSPCIVLCDWNIRCSNVQKTLHDTGVCRTSTKF